jgi:hypothetical protein
MLERDNEMSLRNLVKILPALLTFGIQADPASAQAKYDVGATDTHTTPLKRWFSS